MRLKLTPQTYSSFFGKRIWLKGTRISTVQPALGDGGLGLPDAVPGVVVVDVVGERGVGDGAGRVGVEGVAGALVEVRIDGDHEPVGVGLGVAAAHALADLGRVGVAAEGGDVEGVIVVGDPDLGRFGGGGAVLGVDLGEADGVGRGLPDGLVEAAVEGDGLRGADGLDGLGVGRGEGGAGSGFVRGESEGRGEDEREGQGEDELAGGASEDRHEKLLIGKCQLQ